MMHTADPRRLLLLHEIELQCGFAFRGYGESAAAFERGDMLGFWGAVQAILNAAGRIHGLLGSLAEARGALVPDGSPLLAREMAAMADSGAVWQRWIAEHSLDTPRASNLGPFGASQGDPTGFARHIDEEHSVATIFGHSFNLAELLSALANLRERVQTELRP